MRRTIADRLLQSKTTIPHFYLRLELDAAPLAKLRAEINAGEGADGNKFRTLPWRPCAVTRR